MIEVLNDNLNPYFNIACEEYILKNFSQDCFILWQNSPSIIVGKHQNTLAEINQKFVTGNNLPVVRRISGGGTVYHDLGNLNFTFITTAKTEKIINFRYFTNPIIELLKDLGINATLNTRNNIFIDEKKITGTAAHIFKNKVIHHGTLLFSTSITDLEKSIKNNSLEYSDKAIKSVTSTVTNIFDHLENKTTLYLFRELLRNKINQSFEITEKHTLTEKDIENITDLVNTKYNTWEWNYGYSPSYQFSRIASDNLLRVSIAVKKGIIEKIVFSGQLSVCNEIKKIEKALTGIKHNKETVNNLFINSGFSFNEFSLDYLIKLIL
jgi:lipoate-protein ligase A